MQSPIDNLQSSIPNAPLPQSTELDKNRQNSTKINRNSCPPARAHAREDHTTTLSLKQVKFLRHLLTERTISAATEKAGINRTTFYLWMKDPAFKAEYEQCRNLALTIAKAEISGLSLDAAELLHECLREGYHPNVRLHAASTILRNAQRLTQANQSEPAPALATPAPTPAIPAPTPAIPAPTHVIPAKAGIQRSVSPPTHRNTPPRGRPNHPP